MNGKMSLAEALMLGAETTVIGLAIVFTVLVILMLVLMAMKYIFASKNKQEKEIIEMPVIKAAPKTETQDDEELIAVLTAAVAASLNTSTYNLRIKSYRRIGESASPWQRAGLRETIDNHC